MMNLLDKQSLDKIAETVGTHLWRGFIWISQRKSSSYIHNYAAHKINCRYNHIRIYSALYLRMRHSSYSRNIEFRHPSSPLPRQTDQDEAKKRRRAAT